MLSKQENIHSYYSIRFCNMWLCLELCFHLFTIFHVLMVLSICVYHYYLPSEVSRRVWISRPCLNWVLKYLHKYYPTHMQTGHSLGCLLILSDQIKNNIKPYSSCAITDWTLYMILVSKEINLLLPPGMFCHIKSLALIFTNASFCCFSLFVNLTNNCSKGILGENKNMLVWSYITFNFPVMTT